MYVCPRKPHHLRQNHIHCKLLNFLKWYGFLQHSYMLLPVGRTLTADKYRTVNADSPHPTKISYFLL